MQSPMMTTPVHPPPCVVFHKLFEALRSWGSEEPDIPEQESQHGEEGDPGPPAHPGPIGHPHHASPCPFQPDSGIIELIVDALGKAARRADLVADGNGHLFELRDFGGQQRELGVRLGL